MTGAGPAPAEPADAQLDGKVALVTGGASGIGAATARCLAAHGARVLVTDLHRPGPADPGTARSGWAFQRLDVTDREQWQETVEGVVKRWGRLDIVHLNAGRGSLPAGARADLPLSQWLTPDTLDAVRAVNIDGVVLGALAALPHLERTGGSIVVTSSAAGLLPHRDPFYCLTKHASVGFVRAFAALVGPRGMTANVVCPFGVDTPMVSPEGREAQPLSSPERIAEIVLGLVLDRVNGQIIVVPAGRPEWSYEFAPALP